MAYIFVLNGKSSEVSAFRSSLRSVSKNQRIVCMGRVGIVDIG